MPDNISRAAVANAICTTESDTLALAAAAGGAFIAAAYATARTTASLDALANSPVAYILSNSGGSEAGWGIADAIASDGNVMAPGATVRIPTGNTASKAYYWSADALVFCTPLF